MEVGGMEMEGGEMGGCVCVWRRVVWERGSVTEGGMGRG